MPVYTYKAYSSAGQIKTGIADADSPRDARLKLRREGLLVTDIEEIETVSSKEMSTFRKKLMRRRTKGELPMITRQLSTLLRAGIPLNDGLRAMTEQIENNHLEAVVRDLREKINQGTAFADALEMHPGVFPPFYIAMVRAGEAAGNTDLVLERIAEFLTKQSKVKSKVTNALMYPLIMVGVGVLVVGFLMKAVVPKLIALVESKGDIMPLPTRILKGISEFVGDYWYLMLAAAMLAYIVLGIVRSRPKGRYATDRFMLRMPLFGSLIAKQAISRFSVTLSTLIGSGVPILEAIKIVRGLVGNAVIEKVMDDLHKAIMEGADIASPLKRSGIIPPAVGYMVAVGEQSGQLEDVLNRIAESYDEEINIATERLTAALEPILILSMAVGVGFIVLAVVLPMLQLGA